jgi:hypothetical protein
VLIALCLLAGFAALAGMASVTAALVLGTGAFVLSFAAGFALLSLVCGLGAAAMSFQRAMGQAPALPSIKAAAP